MSRVRRGYLYKYFTGRVAELVDALDLKSNELNTREGSSPSSPTILRVAKNAPYKLNHRLLVFFLFK